MNFFTGKFSDIDSNRVCLEEAISKVIEKTKESS
jgi:hypothetical protein